jgi:hypothetical protein
MLASFSRSGAMRMLLETLRVPLIRGADFDSSEAMRTD